MAIDRGPNWGAALGNLGQGLFAVAQQNQAQQQEQERRQWAMDRMIEQQRMIAQRQAEQRDWQAGQRDAEFQRAEAQNPWVPAGADYGAAMQPQVPSPVQGQQTPVAPLAGMQNPTGAPMRASSLAQMMGQNWLEDQRTGRVPPEPEPTTIPVEIAGQTYMLEPRDAAALGLNIGGNEAPEQGLMEMIVPPGGIPGRPEFSAPATVGLAGMLAPSFTFEEQPGYPNDTPYPQLLGNLADLAVFEREQDARLQRDVGVEGAKGNRQVEVAGVKSGLNINEEEIDQEHRVELEQVRQGNREANIRLKNQLGYDPVEVLRQNAGPAAELVERSPELFSDFVGFMRNFDGTPEQAVAASPYAQLVDKLVEHPSYDVRIGKKGELIVDRNIERGPSMTNWFGRDQKDEDIVLTRDIVAEVLGSDPVGGAAPAAGATAPAPQTGVDLSGQLSGYQAVNLDGDWVVRDRNGQLYKIDDPGLRQEVLRQVGGE